VVPLRKAAGSTPAALSFIWPTTVHKHISVQSTLTWSPCSLPPRGGPSYISPPPSPGIRRNENRPCSSCRTTPSPVRSGTRRIYGLTEFPVRGIVAAKSAKTFLSSSFLADMLPHAAARQGQPTCARRWIRSARRRQRARSPHELRRCLICCERECSYKPFLILPSVRDQKLASIGTCRLTTKK
jgi:hypothetical protein